MEAREEASATGQGRRKKSRRESKKWGPSRDSGNSSVGKEGRINMWFVSWRAAPHSAQLGHPSILSWHGMNLGSTKTRSKLGQCNSVHSGKGSPCIAPYHGELLQSYYASISFQIHSTYFCRSQTPRICSLQHSRHNHSFIHACFHI